MTDVPWRGMGGASERVCGSCICVQISWQIFFLSLSFSFRQISSSGWKEGGLLSRNTVCVGGGVVVGQGGWVWGAVKEPDWKTVFGYF